MKFKLLLFFSISLISLKTTGQETFNFQSVIGNTYISRTSEYFKILNDSTLYSTINRYSDTARFFLRNDTLFIEQHYRMTDGTGTKSVFKLYDYKIISLINDTLRLNNIYRYSYKPSDWEDTLVFINLENMKEPVVDFEYLKLNISSPWSGSREINIDKEAKVFFTSKPFPYSINRPDVDSTAKPKTIYGQLTQNEFKNFKDILSKAMVSKMPTKRDCPLDGTISTFEIRIGNKLHKSTGCDLTRTQAFLLNYLYDIDENQALKTNK